MNKKKILCIILFLIYIFLYMFQKYFKYDKYVTDDHNKKYTVSVIEKKKDEEYVSYLVELKNTNGKFKDKFLLNIFPEKEKEKNEKEKNEKEKNEKEKNENENIKDKTNKEKDKLKAFNKFKYGDVLELNGAIQIPIFYGNIGEFNYKQYLNSKGICGTITGYKIKKVGEVRGILLLKISLNIKAYLNKIIDKSLPKKEGNLLKSMLYGDTVFLDKNIEEDFKKTGITHLLAVSGSNVASVVAISYIVMNKLKISRKAASIYMIYIVVIFTLISSAELSIVRASIMTCILIASEIFAKKYMVWASVYTSFYIILIMNPYSIYNVGMQLSFMATMGIIMFYEGVNDYLTSKVNKYFKPIMTMLAITISAQILIFPLQCIYFHSINPVMFISNILAVALADIICNIGFAFLFVSYIPIISTLVLNATFFFLKFLIAIAKYLAYLDFLEIKLPSFNIPIILAYYTLVVCIYLKSKGKKVVYNTVNILEVSKNLLILFLIIYLIFHLFFNNYIMYFNVGQGDMALIKYKGVNILIDAGSTKKGLAASILGGYLKHECISKINLMLISHAHADHINGVEEISKTVPIKKIMYSTGDVIQLLKNVETEKIKVLRGDRININKTMYLDIISPGIKKIEDKDESNANSLVAMVDIKGRKYAFMGDATESTEKEIPQDLLSTVEILKVGHHGSRTSSSEPFIKTISPKLAIISSREKDFGHPHKITLDKLKKLEIKYHITEKNKFYRRYIFFK
ncbi:MAG: DNA internalization-related competence protein ComEC/Rec2 [Clostridia bacterium]